MISEKKMTWKPTSLWKISWTFTLLNSGLEGATICCVAAFIFGAVNISEKSSSSSNVENFEIDLLTKQVRKNNVYTQYTLTSSKEK